MDGPDTCLIHNIEMLKQIEDPVHLISFDIPVEPHNQPCILYSVSCFTSLRVEQISPPWLFM